MKVKELIVQLLSEDLNEDVEIEIRDSSYSRKVCRIDGLRVQNNGTVTVVPENDLIMGDF